VRPEIGFADGRQPEMNCLCALFVAVIMSRLLRQEGLQGRRLETDDEPRHDTGASRRTFSDLSIHGQALTTTVTLT